MSVFRGVYYGFVFSFLAYNGWLIGAKYVSRTAAVVPYEVARRPMRFLEAAALDHDQLFACIYESHSKTFVCTSTVDPATEKSKDQEFHSVEM